MSATLTNATSALVSYTAPVNNGGFAVSSYTAVSTPPGATGSTATSASGNILVTGLSTTTVYSFGVYASTVAGNSAVSTSSNIVFPTSWGQSRYTPGTYTWVAPAGVTSAAIVLVGGGGAAAYTGTGGSGGSGIVIIRYPNTYATASSTTGSGVTLVNAGGYITYIFTASGTIVF